MVNHSMVAGAEDIQNYYKLPQEPNITSYIYDVRDSYIHKKRFIQYIEHVSGLDTSDCKFLIEESKEKHIDPFIVLGVIKRESDFNPHAKGADGEKGLGQLMENTAKIIAANLGYDYYSDRLLEPKYNLMLTITQLSYLQKLYNQDLHMSLTAYNRGQQGLIDYMNKVDGRGVSDYSTKVLLFATEYKEAFDNFLN